jgi:TetR/AcrR family transcriptional regulator of autoinduction and epiphytic fitness
MAERRERQRVDQADSILKAARKLFAQLGPGNVTMADVAREAGVARATVFNHFGSKHALIESITEDVLAGYVLLLDEALADRESAAPDLVRRAFEHMGRGIEEDRRFYRGVFREIAKLSLGLDEGGPGQRTRQEALVRLEKLLTRGQARGELSAEHRPEDLATAFDSLVFGTITHWLYDDASEPLHLRMQRAAEVFLGAIARDPSQPRTRKRAASSPTAPRPRPARSRSRQIK